MITLYVKTGCPYCHRVTEAFAEHDIAFEEKNIADESALAELMEKGGKPQVPFMIDGETSMYESDAIIAHALGTDVLQKNDTDTNDCGSGVCPV